MSHFPVITSTLASVPLGSFVSQHYLPDPIVRCELVKTGINHTYKLTAGETLYMVRVYHFGWRSVEAINEELQLLQMLHLQGISVAHPIPDKNGHYYHPIAAPEGIRFLVVFSFARGQKVRWMSEATCAAVGAIMAKFHLAQPEPFTFRDSYNDRTLFERPLTLLKQYFSEEMSEMQYLAEIGKQYRAADFHNMDTGLVHLDIWYDNMAVENEDKITLFDFDFCGNGPFILDVAYSCMQLFLIESGTGQYETKKEQFLRGYQKHRVIGEDELSKIPLAGAAVFVFYLGVQAERFDWSNNFLSENYLKMYVGRIRTWLEYHGHQV